MARPPGRRSWGCGTRRGSRRRRPKLPKPRSSTFSPRCNVSTMLPNTVSTMSSARLFVKPVTRTTSLMSTAFVRLPTVLGRSVVTRASVAPPGYRPATTRGRRPPERSRKEGGTWCAGASNNGRSVAGASGRAGDDQAAGCGDGAAGDDVLPHVSGDGDHGVPVERGDARSMRSGSPGTRRRRRRSSTTGRRTRSPGAPGRPCRRPVRLAARSRGTVADAADQATAGISPALG